jgi:hypothetical protein
MDETRDRIEAMPDTEKVSPALPRRKWQTPRVLLADATLTGAQMMANFDHNTGETS